MSTPCFYKATCNIEIFIGTFVEMKKTINSFMLTLQNVSFDLRITHDSVYISAPGLLIPDH